MRKKDNSSDLDDSENETSKIDLEGPRMLRRERKPKKAESSDYERLSLLEKPKKKKPKTKVAKKSKKPRKSSSLNNSKSNGSQASSNEIKKSTQPIDDSENEAIYIDDDESLSPKLKKKSLSKTSVVRKSKSDKKLNSSSQSSIILSGDSPFESPVKRKLEKEDSKAKKPKLKRNEEQAEEKSAQSEVNYDEVISSVVSKLAVNEKTKRQYIKKEKKTENK